MINREFTAVYNKSGKWFSAWVEEIPGVNTQGRTIKEAKENLKEALLLILQINKELSGSKVALKREPLHISLAV